MNTQNTNWTPLIVVLVVLVLLVLPVVLLIAPMMGWATVGPGMMGGYGPGAAGNGWGWLVMLGVMLLLAVLVGLAVWALRRGGSIGPGAGNQNDPLAILRQRYARGEIDREQYEQMKRDLAGP